MPELPEVETTLRGIKPYLLNQHIKKITIRESRLRWPVSGELSLLRDIYVSSLQRRAKYLLIGIGDTDTQHIIIHLGMSGSLRVVDNGSVRKKHDHIDFVLSCGKQLRYHDPRRFGAVLWTDQPINKHKLLTALGPEPLSEEFTGRQLFLQSRKRKAAVKNFIMDGHVVVGVGNIYASEALFMAGVRPGKAAGRVSAAQYDAIAGAIKEVLGNAIKQGGTTLRDFVNSDGQPGYFQQTLNVYGRAGDACHKCGETIKSKVLGQRSTFYCSGCQK